jgi:hypothetical protein
MRCSDPRARIGSFAILVITVSWASAALLWVFFVLTQQFRPVRGWLLDWHVYAAAARDFLDGTLYSMPLESTYPLPIAEFNYPPLAAISVIPLLPLPDPVGGTAWVVLNLLAMAGTTLLVAKILGARQPLLWGGLGFLAYTLHPWLRLAFLGNNTPLVLLLVAAFAYEHLRGRNRAAGAFLGLAIALKLWPVALIPLLLRERRWESLGAVTVVVGGVLIVSLAWLGIGAVGPAVHAMQARAEIGAVNPVLFISWLRETQPWWPSWGGYAVAGILLVIPARGKLGIGLGMLAGLALVPNLWRTYAPTLVVAGVLSIGGMYELWMASRSSGGPGRAYERTALSPQPDSASDT